MTKLGAWKSGNIGACFKECGNRGPKCEKCIGSDKYLPLTHTNADVRETVCDKHGMGACTCKGRRSLDVS